MLSSYYQPAKLSCINLFPAFRAEFRIRVNLGTAIRAERPSCSARIVIGHERGGFYLFVRTGNLVSCLLGRSLLPNDKKYNQTTDRRDYCRKKGKRQKASTPVLVPHTDDHAENYPTNVKHNAIIIKL